MQHKYIFSGHKFLISQMQSCVVTSSCGSRQRGTIYVVYNSGAQRVNISVVTLFIQR